METIGIFSGMIWVKIVSADIPGLLDALTARDIPLNSARVLDELTLTVRIPQKNLSALLALCQRRGEDVTVTGRTGLYWKIIALFRRPVLLSGIFLLMFLTFFLPTRVLFVEVEGNDRVPAMEILEQAQLSGIRFGVSRREVRSEQLKNALLEAIPSLQWAGINTKGCTAVISVRERAETQTRSDPAIGHIVAACDGIILSTDVLSGTGLCSPGQAVRQGQVLISAYTDTGIAIRASRARGEVFATTRRNFRAVTPAQARIRSAQTRREVKFSLRIGKKRINFWKGSGICDTSCDRIYVENCITLPGGFQLPISVIQETVIHYQVSPFEISRSDVQPRLEDFASRYLLGHMVSGTIRSTDAELRSASGTYILEGTYRCTEMIGRFRREEIGE